MLQAAPSAVQFTCCPAGRVAAFIVTAKLGDVVHRTGGRRLRSRERIQFCCRQGVDRAVVGEVAKGWPTPGGKCWCCTVGTTASALSKRGSLRSRRKRACVAIMSPCRRWCGRRAGSEEAIASAGPQPLPSRTAGGHVERRSNLPPDHPDHTHCNRSATGADSPSAVSSSGTSHPETQSPAPGPLHGCPAGRRSQRPPETIMRSRSAAAGSTSLTLQNRRRSVGDLTRMLAPSPCRIRSDAPRCSRCAHPLPRSHA